MPVLLLLFDVTILCLCVLYKINALVKCLYYLLVHYIVLICFEFAERGVQQRVIKVLGVRPL